MNNQLYWRNLETILRGTDPTVSATTDPLGSYSVSHNEEKNVFINY